MFCGTGQARSCAKEVLYQLLTLRMLAVEDLQRKNKSQWQSFVQRTPFLPLIANNGEASSRVARWARRMGSSLWRKQATCINTLSDVVQAFGVGICEFSPRPVSMSDLNDTDVCFFLLYSSSSFSTAGVIAEIFLIRRISSKVDKRRAFSRRPLFATIGNDWTIHLYNILLWSVLICRCCRRRIASCTVCCAWIASNGCCKEDTKYDVLTKAPLSRNGRTSPRPDNQ